MDVHDLRSPVSVDCDAPKQPRLRRVREGDEMIHILQHSIGADRYGVRSGSRNHFVSGSTGSDLEKCLEAVSLGYMVEATQKINPSIIGNNSRLFHVTDRGFSFIANNSEKPPKTTRSQRRYKRWLEYCDCFENFKEFLKWDAEPERSWNQTKTA